MPGLADANLVRSGIETAMPRSRCSRNSFLHRVGSLGRLRTKDVVRVAVALRARETVLPFGPYQVVFWGWRTSGACVRSARRWFYRQRSGWLSGSGLARGWRPQPLSRMVVALPRWRRSVASLRTSQSVTDSLLRGIQLATFCHREWRERLARDLDGLPMGLIAATPQIPLLSRTG
jgi:hypothetical protein